MSKWPMRGHFRYLRFKTFPMTLRTPQCEVFWAFLLSSKHSGVPKDSNPSLFSKCWASPPHLAKVGLRHYIPGVEDLFQVGDHLVKMEHGGSRSRVISWRIWRDSEGKWQFQQESTDEQSFSIFPSNFAPLKLVAEGDQSQFVA